MRKENRLSLGEVKFKTLAINKLINIFYKTCSIEFTKQKKIILYLTNKVRIKCDLHFQAQSAP